MKKYIRASYDHRYSAGRIEEDGTEDFYYDTGFDSWDEVFDWGINHDCTHIYDRQTGEYLPITSAKQTKYFANMVSASDDGADESEWYDWWNDVDGYLMGWDKEFKQLIYDFRNNNGWPTGFNDPLCDKLVDVVFEYVRTHLGKLGIDPNENDDDDYMEFAGSRMLDWLLEDPAAYDFWADYKD